MILNTENKVFFSTIRADTSLNGLKQGDIVKAKILTVKNGEPARIFFNGKIIEAQIAGFVKEGDILNMRVLISDNKVFLIPDSKNLLQDKSFTDNILNQLNLPKNELSTAILSFFLNTESKIEEKSIFKIFNFLKTVKKNKKKAVFAASLLENKGLELTDKNFKKVYKLMFGEEFEEESKNEFNKEFNHSDINLNNNNAEENSESDIFKLTNHINSSGLQWIVVPFSKSLNEKNAKGSLCFLLNLKLKELKKMVLHCKIENESWIFSLEKKVLSFMQENADTSKRERVSLEKLLSQYLQESGITDIIVKYGNIIEENANPVDIRI